MQTRFPITSKTLAYIRQYLRIDLASLPDKFVFGFGICAWYRDGELVANGCLTISSFLKLEYRASDVAGRCSRNRASPGRRQGASTGGHRSAEYRQFDDQELRGPWLPHKAEPYL